MLGQRANLQEACWKRLMKMGRKAASVSPSSPTKEAAAIPPGTPNVSKAVSERIDQLEHQSPPAIDLQLRHFLQRRSHSKALELLEM